MSTADSDGVDEALQGVTHVAVTAAARLGEQLARVREQQARDAQARNEQAVRELTERLNAEREAARASLSPVHRPQWWDTATAEDVTKAYETSRAWSAVDPEAARAEHRIVEEVRDRYGIDVHLDTATVTVADAIDRAQRAQAEAEAAQERGRAGNDQAEAVGLIAAADGADRAAELGAGVRPVGRGVQDGARADREGEHARARAVYAEASPVYDSAERRAALAKGLDHVQDRAAVEARVRSDIAQGRPATDAVGHAPGRPPKARKSTSSPQATRTTQRSEQAR